MLVAVAPGLSETSQCGPGGGQVRHKDLVRDPKGILTQLPPGTPDETEYFIMEMKS